MAQFNLDFLQKHINQFEVRLDKYHLPDLFQSILPENETVDEKRDEFPSYQDIPDFTEPKVCTWMFMNEDEVRALLECHDVNKMRSLLDQKLHNNYPKAGQKMLTVDLLYSIVKYAASLSFNITQTACLLSIFYLTHRYFSMSYTSTAEDAFYMFKEFLVHHSVEFIPHYEKVFEVEEAYNIFHYFCKLYLRHLPIVRLLSLPNFEFELNLTIEPMPVFKKKKKDKKDKKKKKDKKGKGKGKGKGKKKK